jgi:hypothetical protein
VHGWIECYMAGLNVARLDGVVHGVNGVLHGMITWCLAGLSVAWLDGAVLGSTECCMTVWNDAWLG